MKQSTLFAPTTKYPPKDEMAKNAQLLVQAGFINKVMAGVYTYLPLGWKVLKKIESVIRQEMNAAGGQELYMPALHPLEHYKKTKRDSIDVLFHLNLASGKQLVLGQSHEEIIVPLAKLRVRSYKDLPFYPYQIQTKFRNELRAKSGIMRGREFLMKDLYSFHATEEDFQSYYDSMQQHYHTLFNTLGIGEQTYLTFASGGTFSKYSHEFQTVTEAGEDTIHLCRHCQVAVNQELIKEQPTCPRCGSSDLVQNKAIEVGNIFPLKTKFSEAFDLYFVDNHGKRQPVIMGCYGIGLGRVMGTIAELYNDVHGLRWPAAVSPFHLHLLDLTKNRSLSLSQPLYQACQEAGYDVLYDERTVSPGTKLKDADLIGITVRAIVGERTGDKIEIRMRSDETARQVSQSELIKVLNNTYRGSN